MSRSMQCFVTWAFVAVMSTTALADRYDDFREALEAKAKPVTSFDLVVRRIHLDLEPADYNDFRRSVQRASEDRPEGQSAFEWAQRFVQAWTESPNWSERHTTQRGDRFKEIITSQGDKFLDINVYDGLLYCSYCKVNDQLDVYREVGNVAHTNLGSLGVGVKVPAPERIVAFEKTTEGWHVVNTTGQDDSSLYAMDFGPQLELKHRHDSHRRSGTAPSVESEAWYLFHETVDGYLIPRVKVYLVVNRLIDVCSSTVTVVEHAKVNCPLGGDAFALGEIPANTLVVDYRFGLRYHRRYSDYVEDPMNANDQPDGGTKAEHFIEHLNRTKSDREAATTRDGRLGRVAPPPQISEWLHRPPALEKWPTGRPLILDFWNITCGPCIASIPENNELAAWIESKGGSFISIHSATHDLPAIREFLESHELNYAVGWDTPGPDRAYWSSTTFADYGIQGIPSYVTIGSSGRILSYDHLSVEKLEKLLEDEPQEPPRGQLNVDIRPLISLPKAWLASDLETGSTVQSKLFLFRPDTPELTVRRQEGAQGPVEATWTRHSANEQTVYEVQLKAKTPAPGQMLKGQITLIVEYNQQEQRLDIPYELAARP